MEYLERHVVAKFDLSCIAAGNTDMQMKCQTKVNDDAVAAAINLAIEQGGSAFLNSIRNIPLPVDPEPGDGPMILVTLSYFELVDGDAMESFTFEVHDNEFIEVGNAGKALGLVSSRAACFFKGKLALLLEGGAL